MHTYMYTYTYTQIEILLHLISIDRMHMDAAVFRRGSSKLAIWSEKSWKNGTLFIQRKFLTVIDGQPKLIVFLCMYLVCMSVCTHALVCMDVSMQSYDVIHDELSSISVVFQCGVCKYHTPNQTKSPKSHQINRI